MKSCSTAETLRQIAAVFAMLAADGPYVGQQRNETRPWWLVQCLNPQLGQWLGFVSLHLWTNNPQP